MWRMLLDSSFDDLIYIIIIYLANLSLVPSSNLTNMNICFLDLQLLLSAVLETYYYYCHCNVSNITVCALLLACLCVASEPSNWRQLGATFNLARSSCGLLPMFLWRRFTHCPWKLGGLPHPNSRVSICQFIIKVKPQVCLLSHSWQSLSYRWINIFLWL